MTAAYQWMTLSSFRWLEELCREAEVGYVDIRCLTETRIESIYFDFKLMFRSDIWCTTCSWGF
ncbi:Os11g0457700 [Oryza sativa Japonica Group]|uniref:Uncharacterized protein n=3 Tax=Oryza sativa TaxID=4530 RepID=A0A8J8XIC4_ORYSJ|nr:hypothetical protein OsI_36009 [Oryza sativa Indica Group]EEE52060.1 hypothetical protein OsJ_33815 [Oryza sativa Japonica Group]KAB8115199.1 hypothetical protein EE612_055393 [Oryza sativa]BAT13934.1 Os11g0457700 [Oryza sativa Japonica Group]